MTTSTLQRQRPARYSDSAQHATATAPSTLPSLRQRPARYSDGATHAAAIALGTCAAAARQAVANDATWTRASLKHAPPPRSVSVSGTRAVPVVLFRTLRRHRPLGRLTVPRRIIGATCSGQ